MKTTVLQIEPYDNRQSILDKLGRVSSGRVLLVLPRRKQVKLSEIDLTMILRKSDEAALSLGLVSQNPYVADLADQIGIACFISIQEAERQYWNSQTKEKIRFSKHEQTLPLKTLPKKKAKETKYFSFIRKIVIGLSFLAILGLMIFLLPSAIVTLSPARTEKSISFDVWASEKVSSVNVNGNLPLVTRTITLSEEKSKQSTGSVGIPSAYASAVVEFMNLTGQEINLPAGTVVSTLGEAPVRFATSALVTLPGGAKKAVEAGVTALSAGSAANVAAGEIQVIEGSLGGQVAVNNPDAASGGTDALALSPGEDDYATLKKEILKELTKKAGQSFTNGTDFLLIPTSVEEKEIVSEERSIEPGQPGENATLSLTVEFTGSGYSQRDMNLLAKEALSADLSDGQILQDTGITLMNEGDYSERKDGGFQWKVNATGQTSKEIDPEQVRELISGKTYAQANILLRQNYSLAQDPTYQVTLAPFFLPLAPFRIEVVTK